MAQYKLLTLFNVTRKIARETTLREESAQGSTTPESRRCCVSRLAANTGIGLAQGLGNSMTEPLVSRSAVQIRATLTEMKARC